MNCLRRGIEAPMSTILSLSSNEKLSIGGTDHVMVELPRKVTNLKNGLGRLRPKPFVFSLRFYRCLLKKQTRYEKYR
jgi:hypothetical protein